MRGIEAREEVVIVDEGLIVLIAVEHMVCVE